MIYKFIRDGVEEEVKLEKWVWHAVYKDGTDLLQFDPAGVFHQLAEIKQDQVIVFEMINSEDPKLRFSLDINDNMKVLHFNRRAVLYYGTPKETEVTFPCFGFMLKKEQISVYNFITPDNRIITTLNRDFKLIK